MKIKYIPKTNLEKFGQKVYSALVENFSQTFYVAGMVRDLLLGRKIADIDIATSATPGEVMEVLNKHRIAYDDSYKKYGNINALQGGSKIEITTFRKESYSNNRYPAVSFIKSLKIDSQRRDFTVNSLYLSLNPIKILDFQQGLKDLKARTLRFIGQPDKRIKEDPLRVIRAIRFAVMLDFRIEKKSLGAIIKYLGLIDNLTQTKINREFLKIKNMPQRKIAQGMVKRKKILDRYAKVI